MAWNPVRTRHFTAEDTAAADLYTAFAVIVASNGSIMVGRLLVYVFIDDLVVFDVLYFTAVCFISVTILTSVASACLHTHVVNELGVANHKGSTAYFFSNRYAFSWSEYPNKRQIFDRASSFDLFSLGTYTYA